MKRQSAGYGQAGGKGQGQPYSRFQIEGDPTPYIPLWAAGSMVSAVPAHMIGGEGGAYFYGTTKVGGITNMVSNGEVLRPIILPSGAASQDGPFSVLLGGTGAGNYDCLANSGGIRLVENNITGTPTYRINANGELCRNPTTLAAGGYGAAQEPFTMGGITASIANASTALTFSAPVNALALTGAYAYTPMFNAPRPGDIIEIVDGGNSRFFRIQAFPTNATATIYPPYTGTGGAGLACTIRRTGYGSNSHVIPFYSGNSALFYYAGNQLANADPANFSGPGGYGTVECVIGGVTHRMAPVTTPSASNLYATDIAFYKGFLLGMYGGTIWWSTAGFPGGGVNGFLTGDFPDLNTTVVDTQDRGVAFEFLGDQLIALFQGGAWLVQATGIVPEFAFYRLPQVPGALQTFSAVAPAAGSGNLDRPTNSFIYGRSTTKAASRVYFVSEQGLSLIDGAPPAKEISASVENYDWPTNKTNPALSSGPGDLFYDPASDGVLWRDGNDGRGLLIRGQMWSQWDLTAIGAVRGTAAIHPIDGSHYRPMGFAYWNPTDALIYSFGYLESETTSTSLVPWTWATPIVTLGQVYDGFKFGGFEVWGRAATGVASGATLNWTIYGGTDPYHMNVIQGPIAYDYALGLIDSRNKLGGVFDYPFLGFVLTGSKWIELTGIVIFPSDSKAAN